MKKILAVLLVALLAMSLFAGCAPKTDVPVTGGEGAAGTKGTIKLGGLAPLTGNYAEYGKGFQIGWQMALDEINAAGGANGWLLEIEVKDTQGDAVVSSTLATDYAENEEILAILGDFTSGACKANAEIVDRYGIVQLSPTASASDYAGMSDFCFSIMGRQDIEAPFLAKYVLNEYLGAKNISVIRVDSDWGVSCFTNFMLQAEKEGLVVTEEKYKADETDFSSIITKVKSQNPDVLVVMDQGAAVASVFNAADAADWDIPHVALGPGTSEQVVGQLTNPDNIVVTSPFFFSPDDAELMAWKDSFATQSGFEPTIHPACAYDTVYLIANAIEKIGDGEVTRVAIKDALTGMTMEGITGTITFGTEGDIKRNYMICGVKDSKWVVLEGFEYGAAGF